MNKSLQINAREENLTAIFPSNLYIIPVYQRPYSWDISKCEQLWDDLMMFIETNDNSDAYFLGTIIVTNEIDEDMDNNTLLRNVESSSVIDGQQRLTTLSLLMNALFEKDPKNSKLKECLYNIDSRDSDKLKSLRIISKVNNNSEFNFYSNNFEVTDYSKNIGISHSFKDKHYSENFNWFRNKILSLTIDQIYELSDVLLDKVTILKVQVPKREDALVIFKTINDRGMQLDETDILKAEIYDGANKKNEGQLFIESWEALYQKISTLESRIKDFDMSTLFRYYMHIKRGINRDSSKEISLLDFFKGKSIKSKDIIKENHLGSIPWKNIMDDLYRICGSFEWLVYKNKGDVPYLYNILLCYPNLYPSYALITYLFKHVITNDGNNYFLQKNDIEAFISFFDKLMAYSYTTLILKPGVNSIKEVIHKLIISIMYPEDLSDAELTKYTKSEFEKVREYLEDDISNKVVKGYLMILAYINKNTDKKVTLPNAKLLTTEHILPKNWGNNWYDQWNEEKKDYVMNKLGNLVLLDRSSNIKASNTWFEKKKEVYSKGDFKNGEMLDLLNKKSWTYEDFEKRQEDSVRKLLSFMKKSQI